MVHELFLMNCELEHLRKGAAIGITNNEARDVAEKPGGNEQVRQQ